MIRALFLLLLTGLAVADGTSSAYETAIEMAKCYGTQSAFASYIDSTMPMSARAERATEVAADTRRVSLAFFNSAGLSTQEAENAVERHAHRPRVELAARIDATQNDPHAFVRAIKPLRHCNTRIDSQREIVDALLEKAYR